MARRMQGFEQAPRFRASAAPAPRTSDRLIHKVEAVCKRLAPSGWGKLLAAHGLDMGSGNLSVELARQLDGIDRTQPGFEDFALEGRCAIEPGSPCRSLLYHAFASPAVTHWRGPKGLVEVKDFPTLEELEVIENYVYGSDPPSVEDLRARAGEAALAIVVFAAEYRPGFDTVHRRHADMCFARTGIARIGTRAANFQARARGFVSTVVDNVRAVAVVPCRYAAYIAALQPGSKGTHGPLQFVQRKPTTTAGETRHDKNAGLRPQTRKALEDQGLGDADRQFWLPLHKLFDGDECLQGYRVEVRLAAQHVNEKIRRAHLYFGANGHDGGWHEPDIGKHPFVIQSGIAEFSAQPEHGGWLLMPSAHKRLVEPAEYNGKPLTYKVPTSTETTNWQNFESSLNLGPADNGARVAPEYLHARHKVSATRQTNLNKSPGLVEKVRAGNYRARHYVDFTGDGCISVECGALALQIPRRLPAYSIVASPDLLPAVRQSDLVAWTDQSVPPGLLKQVWPVNPGRPDPLSSQRYAANLELGQAGFDALDDTMTAIVGAFGSGTGRQMRLRPVSYARASMLPDGASGVFAPGWDVSFDTLKTDDDEEVTFLTNYGLGSPFPEDSMLCAALSSFWPAVAPDITRTFAPTRGYATATPLTDDVIGLGRSAPWDGIKGPVRGPLPNTVEYKVLAYGDYVEAALNDRFDYSVIAKISVVEYIARTLTMAMVYEALGISESSERAKWSVLSFRPAAPDNAQLAAAVAAHERRLNQRHTYRFEMIRHDGVQAPHPDPAKFDRSVVTYAERVVLFADPTIVLRLQEDDRTWAQPYERRR